MRFEPASGAYEFAETIKACPLLPPRGQRPLHVDGFEAHRLVLSMASEPLALLLTGPFREGGACGSGLR